LATPQKETLNLETENKKPAVLSGGLESFWRLLLVTYQPAAGARPRLPGQLKPRLNERKLRAEANVTGRE